MDDDNELDIEAFLSKLLMEAIHDEINNEIIESVKDPNYKHTINVSLYEMNEFDFDKLGFEFVNKSTDI